MLTNRQIFFQHLALPSQMPLGLEVERAEGIYMYSPEGKRYIDLVSGVCVNNLGHRHPAIVRAVKDQLDNYMHLMVYGEMIQTPQVKLAQRLTDLLPRNLNSVYLVNSGSEAIEGALKLAKRFTGRTEIIGFKNSYHGGTHGALTMLGNEEMKYAYRPLLPDVRFLQFNNKEDLFQITERTACVLVEPVQAEAGVIVPKDDFLTTLRQRCSETGTLLIFDEIQTGFGRTGKLFCFMDYNVTPDILCIMGGGMPIGAFIADKKIMLTLTHNPDFGHITTFGGHPVSAAAAIATLEELTKNPNLINQVDEKGAIYESALKNHSLVKGIRRKGLLISIELPTVEINQKIIQELLQNGLVTDPFFFMPQAFRIAPPLIITKDEIALTLELINKTFKNL